MANKNKNTLPSGSIRIQVYSHAERIWDEASERWKDKKIYESFTAPTKREANAMAAEFRFNKKRKSRTENLTLFEAIEKYVKSRDAVLSPKTVEEYEKIKKNAFQGIMHFPIGSFTPEQIQEAVNTEAKRKNKKATKNPASISAKTVLNEYGLIATVLSKYNKSLDLSDMDLPKKNRTLKELIPPETIIEITRNTPIELPCMIAMWLSFSMSEIRGLKRSSVSPDGYLSINQVVVDVNNKPIEKMQAKVYTRIRKHKIPDYIMELINKIPEEQEYLVTLSGRAITGRFTNLLKKNGLPHMTFHDLRHVNASVMALLRIPDQYAMERGGWKTDSTMKKVYTHTFSKEREDVDALVDHYFKSKISHEIQHGNLTS